MKNKSKQKADLILAEAINRNSYDGAISIKEKHSRPCFDGVNDVLRKKIEVKYNPEYPTHEVDPSFSESAFDKTLDFILEHEIVHTEDKKARGCPKTAELGRTEVLTPMSEVLRSKGFAPVPMGTQGHNLFTYFGNLFTDFIDNNIVCDNRGPEGIFLSYEENLNNSGKTGELFEAFLKLQARTFPKRIGVSMIIPYFSQNGKARECVGKFLDRTNLLEIPKNQRTEYLANEKNWKDLSRVFAEEFSELLDKQLLEKSYFPIVGGNAFADLNEEGIQMEIAIKAYGEKGSEFESPVYMEDNLALLSVYRMLAKKADIKVDSSSREVERQITHVSKRRFDLERDNLDRMGYGLNQAGKLEMRTGKYPVKIRSRYQVSVGNFPEARIGLIDCSGSSKESINGNEGKVMNPWAEADYQWTDTSIYHHELLNIFGLFELFKQKGQLKRTNTKAGIFSNSTTIGENFSDSEKTLLKPTFGGTTLSKKSIDDLFLGKNNLVYLMSDGEISNRNSQIDSKESNSPTTLDYLISRAKDHKFFYVQVGESSDTSRYLEENGINVVYDDGKNSKFLVDLTKREIYGDIK